MRLIDRIRTWLQRTDPPHVLDLPPRTTTPTMPDTSPAEPTFAVIHLDTSEPPAQPEPVPSPPAEPPATRTPTRAALPAQQSSRAAPHLHPLQRTLQQTSPGRTPPPAPPGPAAQPTTGPERWTHLQQPTTGGGHFLPQAKLYARSTPPSAHHSAQHVPFHSYYPNYRDLTPHQRAWYFYWRAQFRQGNAHHTDLSYVFLHIYEVLHGVGFPTPEAAFDHLHAIWQTYRPAHPTIDTHVPQWMTDFTVYYEPDSDAARAWATQTDHLSSHAALHAWLTQTPRPTITATAYKVLVSYRTETNKFHKQLDQKTDLEDLLRRAATLTIEFIENQHGPLTAVLPRSRATQRRTAFDEAVFQGLTLEYDTGIPIYSLLDPIFKTLTELLNGAVRHTENQARKAAGFKPALRDAAIPKDLADHLDRHLYPERHAPPTVQLNTERLAALQQESDSIRKRLLQDNPGAPATPAAPTPTVPALSTRTPAPDTDPLTALLTGTQDDTLDVLTFLRDHRWTAPHDALPVRPGVFISHLIDTLNERAQELTGDLLIEDTGAAVTIPDEYRTALTQALAHRAPPARAAAPTDAPPAHAAAPTDEPVTPWDAFGQQLNPTQRHLLTALLAAPLTDQDLRRLAQHQGVLPDALIEDLNAAAMDTIGDLIIDPYAQPLAIDETYHAELTRLIS